MSSGWHESSFNDSGKQSFQQLRVAGPRSDLHRTDPYVARRKYSSTVHSSNPPSWNWDTVAARVSAKQSSSDCVGVPPSPDLQPVIKKKKREGTPAESAELKTGTEPMDLSLKAMGAALGLEASNQEAANGAVPDGETSSETDTEVERKMREQEREIRRQEREARKAAKLAKSLNGKGSPPGDDSDSSSSSSSSSTTTTSTSSTSDSTRLPASPRVVRRPPKPFTCYLVSQGGLPPAQPPSTADGALAAAAHAGGARDSADSDEGDDSTSDGDSNGRSEAKSNGRSKLSAASKRALARARRKHGKVSRILDVVKLKHRTSLKLPDWQRYHWYDVFDEYVQKTRARIGEIQRLHEEEQRGKKLPVRVSAGIDRIHVKDWPVEKFWKHYEIPNKPVIIQGAMDDWGAMKKWTLDVLKSGPYRDRVFKCGEDDDGHSCKVKLKTFVRYAKYQNEIQDDSPLYVFDDAFDDDRVAKAMLDDYSIPEYFNDDLFKLVPNGRRPPHRWFLVGPARSGSGVHTDPLCTSAWNALVSGAKQWIMFDPSKRKRHVKADDLRRVGEDGEPATYFLKVLPRLLAREHTKEQLNELGIIECIQEPGEVIFVPGGWWHAVLNLSDSVACTQNFCSRNNFKNVWPKTRRSRRHMARRWLEQLQLHFPIAAEEAKRINDRDGWDFERETELARKRRKKKKKRLEKEKEKEREKEAAKKAPAAPGSTPPQPATVVPHSHATPQTVKSVPWDH